MGDRLHGKVAIITGAGSGMGQATARLFHAEGARVVLADISGAMARAAVDLREGVVTINVNVGRSQDSKAMIDLALAEFGRLDILCNIAGATAPMVPFAQSTEEDFDKMIDANLRGVFLSMKHAIPAMLAGHGGSIVNIASTAGLIGAPTLGSYSAAKSGVLGLTRSVALEYAANNIRANTLCLGTIETPLRGHEITGDAEVYEPFGYMIPRHRPGTAQKIANELLFLASDEAAYITGIALPV